MRCRAHHCPEEDLDGERVFCEVHWGMLPASYREQLADSWGSMWWRGMLAACVRELRKIEGLQRERRA